MQRRKEIARCRRLCVRTSTAAERSERTMAATKASATIVVLGPFGTTRVSQEVTLDTAPRFGRRCVPGRPGFAGGRTAKQTGAGHGVTQGLRPSTYSRPGSTVRRQQSNPAAMLASSRASARSAWGAPAAAITDRLISDQARSGEGRSSPVDAARSALPAAYRARNLSIRSALSPD